MDVFEDNQRQLWFTVAGQGLYRYRPDTGKVCQFVRQKDNPDSIDANVINRIYQTGNGDIWVAIGNGMNRFNPEDQSFSLPIKAQNHIKALNIRAVFEDDHQRLWVGTLYNGLSLFDPKRQVFTEVNNNANSDNALTSMSVSAILQDKSGALWLGTLKQGLLKIKFEALLFKRLAGTSQNVLTIGGILNDSKGNIWIAANNNLYQLNEDTLEVVLRVRSKGHINKIVETTDHSLILSIFRQGIYKFDPVSEDNQDPETAQLQPLPSLPNNNLHSIALDQQGTLWASLFRSGRQKAAGLFSLKTGENEFVHHLKDIVVRHILPLDKQRLLLGLPHEGLKIYHLNSGQLTDVNGKDKKITAVWSIVRDSSGQIWVGSQELGLGQFDSDSEQIRFINQQDGLPSNSIQTIVEGEQGILWLGTIAGMTRYEPANKNMMTFTGKDGLPIEQFVRSNSIRTAKGNIIVVVQEQLMLYTPADFQFKRQNDSDFKTLFTSLKVLNQLVLPNSSNPEALLRTGIEQTTHLTLSHKDYLFSLSFASTNYNHADKIRYGYKLKGLDQQWIEKSSDDRIATFTSLPAKTYQLQVRTSKSNGDWHEHYQTLEITVTPPWWQTYYAYTFYVLFIVIAIYTINRRQTRVLVIRVMH
jgi:ligand-binding sensor domain-containing protein